MFWLIVDRILRKRKTELIVTIVLAFLAIGFLALSQAPVVNPKFWGTFFEKSSFALFVAIIVRWVTVWFSETEGVHSSSHIEILEAIASARVQIWISQTWLPGTEADATRIVESKANSIRLLLVSHKTGSPINARIRGRRISEVDAKAFAARSVAPIVRAKDGRSEIRFCYGHHPGWIGIIDSFVFWGPTPVTADNWANDFLFHRHSRRSKEGRFWENQFDTLWKDDHSHNYDTEKTSYNTSLP